MALPLAVRGPAVTLENPAQVRRQGEHMLRRIRTIEKVVQDPEPVVASFARAIKDDIGRQFRVGGDPPWLRLKPNTIAAKGGAAKPLGGPGGSLYAGGRGVRVIAYQSGSGDYGINVWARFPGILHMEGRTGPWVIRAKAGGMLRFVVASGLGLAVQATGARSGLRVGGVPLFRQQVTHPGYPARPFVRVTDSFVRREWTAPLLRFLREGANPATAGAPA